MSYKYVVNLDGGFQTIVEAENLNEATEKALRSEGRSNVRSVRLANEDDLIWHKSMGGAIW